MAKDIKQFAINGKIVNPFVVQEGQIVDKLPPAYYQIKETPFGGYYLERMSQNVSVPNKIYGNATTRKDRVWDMYQRKGDSIGVGLFGDKGAGKTLLANMIANHAIEQGYPVIDVSGKFDTSPEYLEFLNSVGDCVVIFDEFLKHLSKMTGDEERAGHGTARLRQDEMLTFFSGTNNAKRLTILIDNNSYMLSEYFRDRPSRMRYLFNYHGLESEVVEQLAAEYGLSKSKIESLITYNRRNSCTFDMMNEIMYEWTVQPDDTINEIVEVMNVPNLTKKTTTKCKVASFKDASGKRVLENELAETDSDGDVVLMVSVENPFYGEKEMSSDEFRRSDYFQIHDYDYSDFKKNRMTKRIEEKIYMSDKELVGISGNLQAYAVGEGDELLEVEIEVLSRSTKQQDLGYYNALL